MFVRRSKHVLVNSLSDSDDPDIKITAGAVTKQVGKNGWITNGSIDVPTPVVMSNGTVNNNGTKLSLEHPYPGVWSIEKLFSHIEVYAWIDINNNLLMKSGVYAGKIVDSDSSSHNDEMYTLEAGERISNKNVKQLLWHICIPIVHVLCDGQTAPSAFNGIALTVVEQIGHVFCGLYLEHIGTIYEKYIKPNEPHEIAVVAFSHAHLSKSEVPSNEAGECFILLDNGKPIAYDEIATIVSGKNYSFNHGLFILTRLVYELFSNNDNPNYISDIHIPNNDIILHVGTENNTWKKYMTMDITNETAMDMLEFGMFKSYMTDFEKDVCKHIIDSNYVQHLICYIRIISRFSDKTASFLSEIQAQASTKNKYVLDGTTHDFTNNGYTNYKIFNKSFVKELTIPLKANASIKLKTKLCNPFSMQWSTYDSDKVDTSKRYTLVQITSGFTYIIRIKLAYGDTITFRCVDHSMICDINEPNAEIISLGINTAYDVLKTTLTNRAFANKSIELIHSMINFDVTNFTNTSITLLTLMVYLINTEFDPNNITAFNVVMKLMNSKLALELLWKLMTNDVNSRNAFVILYVNDVLRLYQLIYNSSRLSFESKNGALNTLVNNCRDALQIMYTVKSNFAEQVKHVMYNFKYMLSYNNPDFIDSAFIDQKFLDENDLDLEVLPILYIIYPESKLFSMNSSKTRFLHSKGTTNILIIDEYKDINDFKSERTDMMNALMNTNETSNKLCILSKEDVLFICGICMSETVFDTNLPIAPKYINGDNYNACEQLILQYPDEQPALVKAKSLPVPIVMYQPPANRDIKPENIIMNGQLPISKASTLPAYSFNNFQQNQIQQEQVQQQNYDDDIFAFGQTAYDMLNQSANISLSQTGSAPVIFNNSISNIPSTYADTQPMFSFNVPPGLPTTLPPDQTVTPTLDRPPEYMTLSNSDNKENNKDNNEEETIDDGDFQFIPPF